MVQPSQIMEHMEVVGSDVEHVGTVDHMEGSDRIKLTKDDSSDGKHHMIPLDWVDSIDGDSVVLSKPAAEAMRSWEAAM